MPTLINQIVAVEKTRKAGANKALDEAYKLVQKPDLFNGQARSYTPATEDEDDLPPESTPVQVSVPTLVEAVSEKLAEFFDVTAIKDWSNCEAKGDVILEGETQPLIANVPVTYLLFLEKQLTDLHTFVSKMPALDPSQVWAYDENVNAFATQPTTSIKTKKVPRNHVVAEATPQHPAQVQVYHEDVRIGTWNTIKFSGAVPARTIADALERVDKLRDAVKFARERANTAEIAQVSVGETLLNYVFSPVSDLG